MHAIMVESSFWLSILEMGEVADVEIHQCALENVPAE